MSPFEIILGLTLFGFALLAVEVFIPGLVLGLLGGLSLLGAVVVAFSAYGPLAGTFVLAGVCVFVLVGFMIWLSVFPRTSIGRNVMLGKALKSGSSIETAPSASDSAQSGTALTALRPSGTALLGGRKVDVVTEGDFIDPGDEIDVVRRDGMSIIVRKTTGGTSTAH